MLLNVQFPTHCQSRFDSVEICSSRESSQSRFVWVEILQSQDLSKSRCVFFLFFREDTTFLTSANTKFGTRVKMGVSLQQCCWMFNFPLTVSRDLTQSRFVPVEIRCSRDLLQSRFAWVQSWVSFNLCWIPYFLILPKNMVSKAPKGNKTWCYAG